MRRCDCQCLCCSCYRRCCCCCYCDVVSVAAILVLMLLLLLPLLPVSIQQFALMAMKINLLFKFPHKAGKPEQFERK